MATPIVYVICDNNCKFESMTKEQILAAIVQAVNEGTIGDIDTGFITTVKTINGTPLSFFVGTQAEYNELSEEQQKDLFAIITDDKTKEALFAAIAEASQKATDCENAFAALDKAVGEALESFRSSLNAQATRLSNAETRISNTNARIDAINNAAFPTPAVPESRIIFPEDYGFYHIAIKHGASTGVLLDFGVIYIGGLVSFEDRIYTPTIFDDAMGYRVKIVKQSGDYCTINAEHWGEKGTMGVYSDISGQCEFYISKLWG